MSNAVRSAVVNCVHGGGGLSKADAAVVRRDEAVTENREAACFEGFGDEVQEKGVLEDAT